MIYICFTNVANEEAAQVANINQLPGTNGFTSPPKQALHHKNSISIYQVSLWYVTPSSRIMCLLKDSVVSLGVLNLISCVSLKSCSTLLTWK